MGRQDFLNLIKGYKTQNRNKWLVFSTQGGSLGPHKISVGTSRVKIFW